MVINIILKEMKIYITCITRFRYRLYTYKAVNIIAKLCFLLHTSNIKLFIMIIHILHWETRYVM